VFFMYFFFKQQCINETISKRYHKELSLKFRIMIKQKKNERSKLFNNNSLSDMVEFGFEWRTNNRKVNGNWKVAWYFVGN